MHKHFADWYREASIDPSKQRLDLRWNGVERAAEQDFTEEELSELLLWSYGVGPSREEDGLRAPFRAEDDAFQMRGNDQEMAILAAAVIVRRMQVKKEDSLLPLAVASSAMVLGSPVVPDLESIAGRHLEHLSMEVREIPTPPKQVRLDSLRRQKRTLGSLEEGSVSDPQFLPVLNGLFTAIVESLEILRSGENALKAYCVNMGRNRGEEADMYWWVLRHSSTPESDIPAALRAFTLAEELAEVTQFDVPHPSSEAFVKHALESPKEKVAVAEIATFEDRDAWSPSSPFHFAPLLHLYAGAPVPSSLAERTKKAEENEIEIAKLGVAFYRELLIERQWTARTSGK